MDLPNGSVWSWRTDEERKPRQEMVATAKVMLSLTKGVVYVGVVLFVKLVL